jgi:hypothetical protein
MKAHRAAWTLAFGEIPIGQHVCHTCDNPPCVRPDHLFLSDHEGNMRDKAVKGRAYKLPRELNHAAKLTSAEVEQVKLRYANGERQRDIGPDFGVTQAAISWIVNH